MIDWELINEGNYKETLRMVVPRGWLVLYRDWTGDNEISTNMVFVEDLCHEWGVDGQMNDHGSQTSLIDEIELLKAKVHELQWRMNRVCSKLSMDEVTTKKGLKVGQEVYYVLDDALAPGIITSQQGCMYTLGFDDVLISENDLYPTREALIQSQIEHWQNMLEDEEPKVCEHEGDGERYLPEGMPVSYQCKKCREFYR